MKPAEVYASIWELMEASRFDEYMDLFTDDCVMCFDSGLTLNGKDATRQYFEAVMERLPDLHHEVLSIIENEDSLAAEVRAKGTQNGTFMIGGNPVEVNDAVAVFDAVDLIWLRNGLIARWHAYFDRLAMYESLGIQVVPKA